MSLVLVGAYALCALVTLVVLVLLAWAELDEGTFDDDPLIVGVVLTLIVTLSAAWPITLALAALFGLSWLAGRAVLARLTDTKE